MKKIKGNSKDFSRPLTHQVQADFEGFMRDNGLEPKQPLADIGQLGRGKIASGGKMKDAWYILWVNDGRPFGWIGDYTISSEEPIAKWNPTKGEFSKITKEQMAAIEAERERYAQEKAEQQDMSAKRAQAIWERSEAISSHPYLERKGVESFGIKQDRDGRIVMPLWGMHDGKLRLQSVQFINDDGDKMLLKGGKAKGGFHILGGRDLLNNAETIAYCEGYATAASYHKDYNQPTIVAVSAGNLIEVAKTIYPQFPDKHHKFIADFDDSKTGEVEAVRAANYIKEEGGSVEVVKPEELGDYNDAKNALEGELVDDKPNMTQVEVYGYQITDKGRYLDVAQNLKGILIEKNITVDWNVIKKRMDIQIPTNELNTSGMSIITDLEESSSVTAIEDFCNQKGIPSKRVIYNLKLVAREHNPVKEWIESKPWDGKQRLDLLLETVDAEDNNLKNILMKRWLLSCVAVACSPRGAASEGILVFVGKQALGKTMWMKSLAPNPEWLLEGATLNPASKDSVKQCVSYWLCELGELASTFKKADVDMLKAFITKGDDELRLPYDRTWSRYSRRTAFYGSVNEPQFLVDSTGNRRFWVVRAKSIDFRHGLNMQQVWAEVKETMFDRGEQWFLTSEERQMLQESNELFRTQSAVEDLILEHVRFDSQDTKSVQMTSLLRDLGIPQPRMNDIKEAARVLSENGCEPRRSNGKKIYDLDYTPVDNSEESYTPKWSSKYD